MFRRLSFLPALLILASALGCRPESSRMKGAPSRILWAWESPQDLRFLSRGEGVAFLGGELHLEGSQSRFVPRRNPLKVNPGTWLMAVLRVEAREAALDDAQAQTFVDRALGLLTLPGVRALQIDFDARERQRPFYGRVLRDLRARMPEGLPLTMTALASWCLDDPWIAQTGLERWVDEAVPMLFRLGPEGEAIRRRLEQGGDFTGTRTRTSLGLSADEPLPRRPHGRRTYVFHADPWTLEAWDRLRERLP